MATGAKGRVVNLIEGGMNRAAEPMCDDLTWVKLPLWALAILEAHKAPLEVANMVMANAAVSATLDEKECRQSQDDDGVGL